MFSGGCVQRASFGDVEGIEIRLMLPMQITMPATHTVQESTRSQ
jgi:hypothetical protein